MRNAKGQDQLLSRSIICALTAASFMYVNPAIATAAIVPKGQGAAVTTNGNVTNAYPGTVITNAGSSNAKVAVGVYEKFAVDKNTIANLHFNKLGGTVVADNLVNYVGSKIDIQGTVNAIKGNTVGGNLYFLSKEGLAISGNGVINAGSLTVMTPTDANMITTFTDEAALQTAFKDKWDNISAHNIPINPTGTITVQGHINTTDGMNLKAAHIDVSKDTTVNGTPLLQSGVVNFADLVNIKQENGQTIDAGLTGVTMTATKTENSGDIVLAAVANDINTKDENFSYLGANKDGNNAVVADIKVDKDSVIKADGNVQITADATIGEKQKAALAAASDDKTSKEDLLGIMAKTTATVTIDGTVEAVDITAKANAENYYVGNSLTNSLDGYKEKLVKKIQEYTESDVNIAIQENAAKVEIGANADLKATGNLNVSATATLTGSAGGGTANGKVIEKLKKKVTTPDGWRQYIPNAGVTYLDNINTADVIVKGKVTSGGDATIGANATLKTEAATVSANKTKAEGESGANTKINAAITIANITNKSTVDISGGNKTITGNLKADALTTSDINTSALVEGAEISLVNTAINVTTATNTANMNLGGTLAAAQMDMKANTTITNTFEASNTTGLSDKGKEMANTKGTDAKTVENVKKKADVDAAAPSAGSTGDAAKASNVSSLFTAGASVGVFKETNIAKVAIDKTANLTATGDLNVSAQNVMKDNTFKVTGTSNNYNKKVDQTSMINASVLVSNMDSSAVVTIEGDATTHAKLSGANVNIAADSEFEYRKVKDMYGKLVDIYQKIKKAYETDVNVIKGVNDLLNTDQATTEKYLKDPSSPEAQEYFSHMEALTGLMDGSTITINKEAYDGIKSLPEKLKAFTKGENYANFIVTSTTGGKDTKDDSGQAAKLAVAGSVNINSLANNAQVVVGTNSEITATKELNLTAKAVQQDVTFNGKVSGLVPNTSSVSGADMAVGGNVGIHSSDVGSLVVVAEGASLTADKANFTADNDVMHYAGTFGGGKGGTTGITGMAATMGGSSDNIVAVDDEAKLKVTGALSITGKNNTNIQNVIVDVTTAGTSALGASVGVVDYSVNNLAGIADTDKDSTREAKTVADNLNTKLLARLNRKDIGATGSTTDLTGYLGTAASTGSGSVTATSLVIGAKTTGLIDTISVAGVTSGADDKQGQNKNVGTGFGIPVNIAGAGSASVNIVDGNTAGLLEGTDVTLTTAGSDTKTLTVTADDDVVIGAYSGAAAIKKQGVQKSDGFNTTLAGAIAYNKLDRNAGSQIKQTNIKGASQVTNKATTSGATVALGLALGVEKINGSSASGVNAGLSASANEITGRTEAVVKDVSVNANDSSNTTSLLNVANKKDLQIAGGVNAQYAKSNLALGLAFTENNITNNVAASIVGSRLTNMTSVENYAITDLTQIGTAVGVGVVTGQSSNGVEGAAAINNFTNTVKASVADSTIYGNTVVVKAFDGKLTETESDNKHTDEVKKAGIDVDGSEALADANASGGAAAVDQTKLTKDATGKDTYKSTAFKAEDNKGNLIVAGAMGLSINTSSGGKATAGAAYSLSTIDNTYTTNVNGSDLKATDAKGIDLTAKTDTLVIDVAAGVAAATGTSGLAEAGSAAVTQYVGTTKAIANNSSLTADKVSLLGDTRTRLITVGGAIAATKGNAAAGLVNATNTLDSTTGAYLYGGTVQNPGTNGLDLSVTAKNDSKIYAIGAGVAASTGTTGFVVNGTTAVNRGENNTEAIVDAYNGRRTTINSLKELNVTATNESSQLALAGGVSGTSATAAIGGAIAYNEIGKFTSDTETEKKQKTRAALNNTDVTTKLSSGAPVTVKAKDTSDLTTIALGVAIDTSSSGAAVQGSAATALSNKETVAEINDAKISNKYPYANKPIMVLAENKNTTVTSSDVLAGSNGNAAIGAAVSVNRLTDAVTATMDKVTAYSTKTVVEAKNDADVLNISIGGAGNVGSGIAASGNVIVNNIDNDTTAGIKDSNINTSGTTGVKALGTETLRNYAGALAAVTGTGFAAGGLTVGVNTISGDTNAYVQNSNILSYGFGNSYDGYSGLLISAEGTHTLKNVLVTAGLAVTDKAGVAIAGTVGINKVTGTTQALLNNSDVNKDDTDTENTKNVNVLADDTTKIDSGSLNVAVGIGSSAGVGIGAASDSNTLTRVTSAQIKGNSPSSKNTIHSNELNVKANADEEIDSFIVGISGGGGTAGVGIAGTVSTTKLAGQTMAGLTNVTSINNGLTVAADNVDKIWQIGNSAAIVGGEGGASVGIGVNVVNTSTATEALVTASDITHWNNTAKDSITANNNSSVTSEAGSLSLSIAIGAGVGTVVTVNNIDDLVKAEVTDSRIAVTGNKADTITIGANNDLTTKFTNVAAAASSLAGVAVGIGVNNIDTSVVTAVKNSKLTTKNADVYATEKRDVTQKAVAAAIGGGAIGTNVMITDVGTNVVDHYGDATTGTVDLSKVFAQVDTTISKQNDILTGGKHSGGTLGGDGIIGNTGSAKNTGGALSTSAGTTAPKNDVSFDRTGGNGEGVKVKMDMATVTADNTVNVKTKETNDITMDVYQGSVGLVGVNVSVGSIDVKHNNAITITNGSIVTGKAITLDALTDGTIAQNVYQGSMGGASVNVTNAKTQTTGDSTVTISDSTIGDTTSSDVTAKASDKSKVTTKAIGAVDSIISTGVLLSTATDTADVGLNISRSNIVSDGNIVINAKKENQITAISKGGSFGAAGLNAMETEAKESGTAFVKVQDKNTLVANEDTGILDLRAIDNPFVTADSLAYTIGILGSGGASVATATAEGGSIISVGTDNKLTAGLTFFVADVGMQVGEDQAERTVNAYAEGNSGGGIGGAVSNKAIAQSTMTASVDIGKATYKTRSIFVLADNTMKVKAAAAGVTINGLISSGTNIAVTKAIYTTNVNLAGSTADSQIENLNVYGNSYSYISNTANGNGGGIVDYDTASAPAAKADNTLITKTKINLSGDWNLSGEMAAQAVNEDDIYVNVDSVKASVVGASGSSLTNDVEHNAEINITGNINTQGKQHYQTGNEINHDVQLNGSGYSAGINLADSSLKNTNVFASAINVNGAKLHAQGDNGDILAVSYTKGNLDYENKMTSFGLLGERSKAESTHNISYNNAINVAAGSEIITAKANQDITLSTYDDTNVALNTTAKSDASLDAVSNGSNDVTFSRSNKVNLAKDSSLASMHDVNLYGGSSEEGVNSNLIYTVSADAYNHSLIPWYTGLTLTNNMSQSNQVNVAGIVVSIQDTNIKADTGYAEISQSAQEHRIYNNTGEHSVVTVEKGTSSGTQVSDNKVSVTGSITAGLHNNLDLVISGNAQYVTEPNGEKSVIFDNVSVTTGAGQDWFDVDSVVMGGLIKDNALIAEYNKLRDLRDAYGKGSAEYTAYNNEMTEMAKAMVDMGFATEDKDAAGQKTGTISIDKQLLLPAAALPDIVISGGDINISTDKLEGTGTMTAKGARELSITNSSNLALEVEDLTIGHIGGSVSYNDALLTPTSKGGFAGTINIDNNGTLEPVIKIITTTGAIPSSDAKEIWEPDTAIYGNISNASGNVIVKNNNYNINVDGNATISGQNITLEADQGSVTQNSPTSIANVGTDPVTKYQFTDGIAKKIQSYLSAHANTMATKEFATYADYITWLKTEDFGFTPEEKALIDQTSAQAESKGIVAGKNIYINALNINVGGLIQSGYNKYNAVLTAADTDKVTKLDTAYAKNPSSLTDYQVVNDSNNTYLISGGEAVWNTTTKTWDYNVAVYYNPSSKTLLTASINPGGGKIYLSGAIASTGEGRILAMDGAADITVNTTGVDRNLQVNTIQNENIAGMISIKDNNIGKVTEIMKDKYRVRDVGDLTDKAWTDGTYNGGYYTPTKQNYNWTGGVTGANTVTNYKYTQKFALWGLIDYSKTDTFIEAVKNAGGTPEKTSYQTGDKSNIEQGVYIDGATTDLGGKYVINTKENSYGEETLSGVTAEKHYDHWYEAMIGKGWAEYTWTGVKGINTNSTYSISAGQKIQIGFLSGTNDQISITGAKDVTLNGNISNAIDKNKMGIGSVTVKSTEGSIATTGDALIGSDNVTLTAVKNIIVNHSALGDNATLNANSATGNIELTSVKGNITLAAPTAGDYGAAEGNFSLTAMGNIISSKNYRISGQIIDLTSKNGSINAFVDSSDANSDFWGAVNATAKEDITLSAPNGDMRLGSIVSKEGDVNLTTAGSFVDATNDAIYSDAADKVDRWLELGLIDGADADDSKTASAAAAKNTALSSAELRLTQLADNNQDTVNAYKAAGDAYANDATIVAARSAYAEAVKKATTDEERAAALATFQTAQKAYFADKGYDNNEQTAIAQYGELNKSTAYGWTKNQLLYSIQDTVINSEPGATVTVETPNISGKNITLNAGKNVGVDTDAVTISYADLGNKDNLELLAQAKAGELTWDDTNKTVTLRQQKQITLALGEEGKLTLNANTSHSADEGNVFIAGVKDTKLDITGADINTVKNVRLLSDKGVAMDTGKLTANDLTIFGGAGDIGSAEHNITTNLSGTLYTNTDMDHTTYIHQITQPLTIGSAVGGTINLTADEGMVMTTEAGKTLGYLNGKEINLFAANGDIGTAEDGIRILNNDATIAATAKTGSVSIQGIGTGNLNLGKIIASTAITYNSEGSVTTTDNITAGNPVKITTVGNIELEKGSIKSDNVILTSSTGAVDQKTTQEITAHNRLTVSADKGINLASGAENGTLYNDLNNVTLTNNTGNIVLGNGGNVDGNTDRVLNVNVTKGNEGDINIHNYKKGNANDMVVTGSLDAGSGDITIINDEKKVTVTDNEGEITGTDVTIKGNTGIVNKNTIDAQGNVSEVVNSGNILNTKDITAAGTVEIKTKSGNVINQGAVTAGADVILDTANGDITNSGPISSTGGAISLTTQDGKITNSGVLDAAKTITFDATGTISNTAQLTAAEDVKLHTLTDIDNTGAIISGKDTNMQAGTDLTNSGTINSQGNVSQTTENGNIINNAAIEAAGNITDIAGKGNVTNNAPLTAGKVVTIATNKGDININANVTGNDFIIDNQEGNIISPRNDRDSTVPKVVITATNGDGAVYTEKGDVTLYEVYAKDVATAYSNKGNLSIYKLNGDILALGTLDKDGKLDIKDITAGSVIHVDATKISLDGVKQRPGNDNMLLIDLLNPDREKPLDDLVVNFDPSINGIIFDHLWVNNAQINVPTGNLYINKLSVGNKGVFTSNGMTTTVYGGKPIRDGSDSIYWYDTKAHNPLANLDGWYDLEYTGEGQGWMHLHFGLDGLQQVSNGVLLNLHDYYKVYNQRYTGVDYSLQQLDTKDYLEYRRPFNNSIGYYHRYDLYDWQEE